MVIQKKIHMRRLLRNIGVKTMADSNRLKLGEFGIVCTEAGLVTRNQKEAVRKLLARRLKPLNGRYWLHVTYFVWVTKKSKSSRMGKGRGAFLEEKAPLKKGNLICEFLGLDEKPARELHKLISKKLPVQTTIISNVVD